MLHEVLLAPRAIQQSLIATTLCCCLGFNKQFVFQDVHMQNHAATLKDHVTQAGLESVCDLAASAGAEKVCSIAAFTFSGFVCPALQANTRSSCLTCTNTEAQQQEATDWLVGRSNETAKLRSCGMPSISTWRTLQSPLTASAVRQRAVALHRGCRPAQRARPAVRRRKP